MLTIHPGGQAWWVSVNPQGTAIGRGRDCDVVVDSPEVSRRHAKICQMRLNQWAIEDLGSTNGTFVNGQRVQSCVIAAEDVVQMGPVTLVLGGQSGEPAPAGVEPQPPRILVEDFGTEVFYDRPRLGECTAQPYPKRLDLVKKRLSELTDPSALRWEVCRALAQGPGTASAIFRVPPRGSPLSGIPDVLAYHFGDSGEDTQVPSGPDGRWHPSHRGFRVSRRLLQAVRANGRPLMSKSIFSCETTVTLSIIDEHSPRALICAPIGPAQDALELLYVDVPIDDRMVHGPEEMFAFVQAVARQATALAATANTGSRPAR
jgi:hypothetical protein